jgi:hypothetical protein
MRRMAEARAKAIQRRMQEETYSLNAHWMPEAANDWERARKRELELLAEVRELKRSVEYFATESSALGAENRKMWNELERRQ